MSKIQEYAKIRALQAQLEEQRRALEPLVAAEAKALGEKSVDTEYGKVTVSEGFKYTYSDSFYKKEKSLKSEAKKITDQIKMIQEDEKEQGIAIAEPTLTVGFKEKK
jgi:hypothetical protein